MPDTSARTSRILFDRTVDDSWLLPPGTTLGPLDAVGRFIVFSVSRDHLVAGDTNIAPDIFALNLTALFDADADGLDDRWERTVGLSTSVGTGDDGRPAIPTATASPTPTSWRAAPIRVARVRGTSPRGITGAFFDTQIALANPARRAGHRGRPVLDRRRPAALAAPAAAAARRSGTVDVETIDGSKGRPSRPPSNRTLRSSSTAAWRGERTATARTARRASRRRSPRWYFAEGATGGPFDLFYLLQNPSDAPTDRST